ncbi:MAG: hypothetical protein ABR962_07350 [Candidatus Bathyarchaeia archaeon]
MPHVVFDEDLSCIEKQIAEIKNELSSIENIIKQIRGEEQKKTHTKLKTKIQT